MDPIRPLRDVLKDYFRHFDEVFREPKVGPRLSTGIAPLDALLGGLRPGGLTLITGRPGSGRRTLALTAARAVALRAKERVLLLPGRLIPLEVAERLVLLFPTLRSAGLRSGNLERQEMTAITEAAHVLAGTRISVCATTRRQAVELPSLVSAWANAEREHRAGLVVVLDAMDIAGTAHLAAMLQAATDASDGAWATLAVAPPWLGAPPGGELEAVADTVVMTNRPAPEGGDIDVTVVKQPSGPLGRLRLHLVPGEPRFVEADPPDDEPAFDDDPPFDAPTHDEKDAPAP